MSPCLIGFGRSPPSKSSKPRANFQRFDRSVFGLAVAAGRPSFLVLMSAILASSRSYSALKPTEPSGGGSLPSVLRWQRKLILPSGNAAGHAEQSTSVVCFRDRPAGGASASLLAPRWIARAGRSLHRVR